jgi:hypothetical protein
MCEQETQCERPDQLAGKPEQCSAEQIRKCHGDVKGHPCAAKPKQDD